MAGSIDTITNSIAGKSLDAMWKRTSVIANNIANNDTPGFKASTVNFEDQLSSALSDNNITETELSGINPVVEQITGTFGADGNGVDIETQMIELTRNQLQYSYLERSLSDNLGLLLTAARAGK